MSLQTLYRAKFLSTVIELTASWKKQGAQIARFVSRFANGGGWKFSGPRPSSCRAAEGNPVGCVPYATGVSQLRDVGPRVSLRACCNAKTGLAPVLSVTVCSAP